MSAHAPARWLVAYDIADKRRLGRVFRLLKKNGVPVQYSVFAVRASSAQMGSLMVEVAQLIDAKADDVRAYCLPERSWSVTLGSAILPDDLWIDP
jgi:CRISPR-associated protein Cas2